MAAPKCFYKDTCPIVKRTFSGMTDGLDRPINLKEITPSEQLYEGNKKTCEACQAMRDDAFIKRSVETWESKGAVL